MTKPMQEKTRPGVYMTIINRSPGTGHAPDTGGGGDVDDRVILTAEIRNGVFYLTQTPSYVGFTVRIRDGVFYLVQPPTGSNYTAEIQNDIFYLMEE